MNIFLLRKITIIFSLLGILLLIFFTYSYVPPSVSINSVLFDYDYYLDKTIYVSGKVRNLTIHQNYAFFDVCDGAKCLSAVYFNIPSPNLLFLKENQNNNFSLTLKGKVSKYNNSFQINVMSISYDS